MGKQLTETQRHRRGFAVVLTVWLGCQAFAGWLATHPESWLT